MIGVDDYIYWHPELNLKSLLTAVAKEQDKPLRYAKNVVSNSNSRGMEEL